MKRRNLLIGSLLCFLIAGFIAYQIVWAFPPTPPAPNDITGNAATCTTANGLAANVPIVTNSLTATGGTISGITSATVLGKVDWGKAPDIASATTTDIGAANGVVVDVTGTTTITSFGNVTAGITRLVTFVNDGLTITHNATSLILPGATNITTKAGASGLFVSLGSGNWRCVNYSKASGLSLGRLDEQIVASNATLTRDVMFGGQINTFGQTNDTTITLLAIEKGMNFCTVIGTTVAKYLRIDPNGSDSIYDGTTTAGDGKYFGVTSAVAGQKICFEAFQTGATTYDWSVSYLGAWATE